MRSSQQQFRNFVDAGREEWPSDLRSAILESELRMTKKIYQLQVQTSDQSLAVMRLVFFVYWILGLVALGGLAFALTRT